mgnify:CR=1 FL=1
MMPVIEKELITLPRASVDAGGIPVAGPPVRAVGEAANATAATNKRNATFFISRFSFH